jgi:hypothetical protein
MYKAWFSLLIAIVLVNSASIIWLVRGPSSAHIPLTDLENQLLTLREQVTQLNSKIQAQEEALSKLQPPRLLPVGEAVATVPQRPQSLQSTRALETPAPPGDPAQAPEVLLARLAGNEGAAALRHLVHQMIREDRDERRQDMHRRAEEQKKEWEELQKGPYGKYNFKVNSLARKLNLNDRQKQHYHDTLAQYGSRFEELRKNANMKDAESRKAYRQNKKTLQEEFESVVVLGFSQEQAQDYKELPGFERSAENAAVFFGDAPPPIAGLDLGEGGGAVRWMIGGEDGGVDVVEQHVEFDPAGGVKVEVETVKPSPETADPPAGERADR